MSHQRREVIGIVLLGLTLRYVNGSQFSEIATIGKDSKSVSNEVPSACVVTKNGTYLYMVGTTEWIEKKRIPAVELYNDLDGSNLFISLLDTSNNELIWTVRDGTEHADAADAAILDRSETHLFVSGSTYGNFSGGLSKGISDIYLAKYSLAADVNAKRGWPHPLVLGSEGIDGVNGLAIEGDLVYGVGYTGGSLFGKNRGGNDAVLFAVHMETGALRRKVQVGTEAAENGVAMLIAKGCIIAAVEVERLVNNLPMTNIRLYKFTKGLALLGDVLLETFAAENVADVIVHPRIPSALLVIGTSKVDDTAREDIMFRRVDIDTRNDETINSKVIKAEEVEKPEFVTRFGGKEVSNDYARAALLHRSNRVIVAGFSTGDFGEGAANTVMEPVVASMDARDGAMRDVLQDGGHEENEWRDLRAAAIVDDKLYWVGQSMDWSSNTFFAYVGLFDVPKSWQTPVDFSQPGSGNDTNNKPRSAQPTFVVDFKKVIYVAASIGGFVLLVIILFCFVRCYGKRTSPMIARA